jgi:hypothetical protein
VPAKGSRGPWIFPLAITAIGLLLLLNNFLLLGDFNIGALWPLLLVLLGATILLRGDFTPNAEGRTFGITRGSVEQGTLEISSGEIDVMIRALQQEGRLIAGQFASNARPALRVNETHTYLKMDRASTPWLSFADWEMGLARDLPWQILISTHLGQVNVDLSGLIIQTVGIGTGFGDIRLVAPLEALDEIKIRSTLGNIHIITPVGHRTQIIVETGRLFKVHADERRYAENETGRFEAFDAEENAPQVVIHVNGTFGDAYLT